MAAPHYSGLTDKCREALLAAADEPSGWLPDGTPGAVLGRLYKLGLAKQQKITDAGREWVSANRFYEEG